MRNLLWTVLLIGVLGASPAVAEDSNDTSTWYSWFSEQGITVTVLGNEGVLYTRFGVRSNEKTEVGLEVGYVSEVSESEGDAGSIGLYATYDVAEKEIALLGTATKARSYVGVKADLVVSDGTATTAALMTGVVFGGDNILMGMEIALYAPNEWLGWSSITDISDDAEILAFVNIRF